MSQKAEPRNGIIRTVQIILVVAAMLGSVVWAMAQTNTRVDVNTAAIADNRRDIGSVLEKVSMVCEDLRAVTTELRLRREGTP